MLFGFMKFLYFFFRILLAIPVPSTVRFQAIFDNITMLKYCVFLNPSPPLSFSWQFFCNLGRHNIFLYRSPFPTKSHVWFCQFVYKTLVGNLNELTGSVGMLLSTDFTNVVMHIHDSIFSLYHKSFPCIFFSMR